MVGETSRLVMLFMSFVSLHTYEYENCIVMGHAQFRFTLLAHSVLIRIRRLLMCPVAYHTGNTAYKTDWARCPVVADGAVQLFQAHDHVMPCLGT